MRYRTFRATFEGSGQYMASGFCFPSIQQRQQRTGAHFQTMPTEKPHLP